MERKIPVRFVESGERSFNPQEPRQGVVPPQNDEATAQQEYSESVPTLSTTRGVERQQGTNQETRSTHYRWTWKGVVELLTLFGIFGTLVATCQQNEVMKHQLVLAERPWVASYLTLSGPFDSSKEGDASLEVTYTLANLGHSVAQDVKVYVEMFPFAMTQSGFDEPWDRQRDLCERMKEVRVRSSRRMGHAIFPNEPHQGTYAATMKKEDIATAIARMDSRLSKEMEGYISPMLIGCVLYRFSFSSEEHATGFIYNVFRYNPTKPQDNLLIEINKTLPLERMKLELFPFGGRYAD